MTFLNPSWLALLVPLAGLAGTYVWLQHRRRHHAVRFTNLDLLASLAPTRPGWRRHLVTGFALVGIAALVLALARPTRNEEIAREEATVVLVVDVSSSMDATDVSPSRIEAAKAAAADFVADLPDDYLVGLVAFDQTARVLASPTGDHDAVTAAISGLSTGRGTAAGEGLTAALSTLELLWAETTEEAPVDGTAGTENASEGPSATVVLLSDGETTVGRSLDEAVQDAVDMGIPVTTIAYGTDDASVTIEGQAIPVPADDTAMEAVAAATGGTYFAADSTESLTQVLDDIESRLGSIVEQREILRFFVGLAVAALMAAVAASMYWNARFM